MVKGEKEKMTGKIIPVNGVSAPRPPPLPTAATGRQSCGRGREGVTLTIPYNDAV